MTRLPAVWPVMPNVQVDDSLSAVQQVAVLGGHRQSAGTANPNYVGAQIREHHRSVRPGSDTAQFDYSHPGEGSGIGHTQHSRTAMSARAKSISRDERSREEHQPRDSAALLE